MSYLKITPGVSRISSAGRILHPVVYNIKSETKEKIFERDNHTCRYCGFKSAKYNEVNFIAQAHKDKKNPRKDMVLDNYATACCFCYQSMHLEKIDRMQSGALIWLPEIGQAALNHICRAIYVARISRGPMADAAKDSLEALLARKEEAKKRLGTDSPKMLASILMEFLELKEYKLREEKLKGFCILPLDKRIVQEGELEFNQFPQMLAYWRSKDGPFGSFPPGDWAKSFFEVQEKIKKAA